MAKLKYRFSPQRQAILETVRELKTHAEADEIFQAVRKKLPDISLSTVYRNLNQLLEMGEISSLKDQGILLYEGNLADHDHFYCRECKTWYDVDVLSEGVIASFTRGQNFRIETLNLEFSGICETCLLKQQGA